MKGLIMKDFINLKSQLKIYMLIAVLCVVIITIGTGPETVSGLTAMFAVLIPITAEAYDKQSNWNRFAISMPVSKQELVISRYLFMEIIMLIMAGVNFIGNFVWYGVRGRADAINLVEPFFVTMLLLVIANIIFAVMMPIIFKFGVEKGRIIFFGIIIGAAALAGIFARGGSNGVSVYYMDILASGFNKYLALALIFIITAIIQCISIRISINIYKNKDF